MESLSLPHPLPIIVYSNVMNNSYKLTKGCNDGIGDGAGKVRREGLKGDAVRQATSKIF